MLCIYSTQANGWWPHLIKLTLTVILPHPSGTNAITLNQYNQLFIRSRRPRENKGAHLLLGKYFRGRAEWTVMMVWYPEDIRWVTQRTCSWLVLAWLVKWSSCGESVEWLLGALRYLHNSKSCYLPTISAVRLFHNIFNNQCLEGIRGIMQRIERILPWLPLSSPLAIVWLSCVLTEAIFDKHFICL